MDQNVKLLEDIGVVLRGHFIGTQGDVKGMGRHLTEYVDKDVATSQPVALRQLARNMAALVKDLKIDVVAAPAVGAICLGAMVAEELGIRFVYLEKEGDGIVLSGKRTAFKPLVAGANVLLVEDIVNQGQTVFSSIKAIKEAGGKLAGVTCIWNRSGLTDSDLGVEVFRPLINEQLSVWTREQCLVDGPCSKNVPINLHPGHGAAFSKLFPGYPGGFVD